MMDAVPTLHGAGGSVFGPLSYSGGYWGDVLVAANYSNAVLDLGDPGSASVFPWMLMFPARTEAAYTFPPEQLGQGGVEIGMHIKVTRTYLTTMTYCTFYLCSGSSATPTYSSNSIASRYFVIAQLVAGMHFFIPLPLAAFYAQRYHRAYFAPDGSASYGMCIIYIGPREGGEA